MRRPKFGGFLAIMSLKFLKSSIYGAEMAFKAVFAPFDVLYGNLK